VKHVVDIIARSGRKSHAVATSVISRHFFKKPERRTDFAQVILRVDVKSEIIQNPKN